MTVSHRDYYWSQDRTVRGLYLCEDAMRDTWHVMHQAREGGRRAEARLWCNALFTLRNIRRALMGRDKRPSRADGTGQAAIAR